MDDAHPWTGRFEGREAFKHALCLALERSTAAAGAPMLWCDPNFADWPLQDPDVCQRLHVWALAGGRLRLLASDYAGVVAAARFVTWRRQWDHRIAARCSGRQHAEQTPSVLLLHDAYLWRAEGGGHRFVVSTDLGERTRWQERVESLWQTSVSAFPASTLGL